MKKKIIGMLIVTLLIATTVIPVIGSSTHNAATMVNIIGHTNKDTSSSYTSGAGAPIVVIEIPENGRTFCLPDISVYGYAEDDNGIVALSILHEWTSGSTITNICPIYPPQPHYDIGVPTTLEIGWNKITITAEDADFLSGEASITVYYTPIPDITPPAIDVRSDAYIFFKENILVNFTASDECGVAISQIWHNYSGGGLLLNIDYLWPWPTHMSFDYSFSLKEGANTIAAKAVDAMGNSAWDSVPIWYIKSKHKETEEHDHSDALIITLLQNRAFHPLFQTFLENHPRLFPLLRNLREF